MMSRVRYALNKTKIKGGDFISSLLDEAAINRIEKHDEDKGVGVQKVAYHSAKRRCKTSKTFQKLPSNYPWMLLKKSTLLHVVDIIATKCIPRIEPNGLEQSIRT